MTIELSTKWTEFSISVRKCSCFIRYEY